MIWFVLVVSEFGKIMGGELKGKLKVITEFLEITEMATVSGSEVFQALLFGKGISYTGMVGIFKAGTSQSNTELFLNQSYPDLSLYAFLDGILQESKAQSDIIWRYTYQR